MNESLKKTSVRMTNWIGTPASVVIHSLFFASAFVLPYFGIDFDRMLLILTTAVSLEAIYLAIFIQMTVNRHAEQIEEVGEDIEEIQEEVEGLGEDVQEISEDIEEIHEEQTEDDTEGAQTQAALQGIQAALQKLVTDVEAIKTRTHTLHHESGALNGVSHEQSEETGPAPAPTENNGNYLKRLIDFVSLRGKPSEESVVHEADGK
jgi:uncharacterized protein YoxC